MGDTAEYTEDDEDRCYYGSDGKVTVHRFAAGWGSRGDTSVPLRKLASPDPSMVFNWGYTGSGANQVSIAIIADALAIPAAKVPLVLYQAFTSDFVSQFPNEFRIRRFAVLRWLRGYYCDRGTHDFPADLPAADPNERRRRKTSA